MLLTAVVIMIIVVVVMMMMMMMMVVVVMMLMVVVVVVMMMVMMASLPENFPRLQYCQSIKVCHHRQTNHVLCLQRGTSDWTLYLIVNYCIQIIFIASLLLLIHV